VERRNDDAIRGLQTGVRGKVEGCRAYSRGTNKRWLDLISKFQVALLEPERPICSI
jgi:hypothetical protein